MEPDAKNKFGRIDLETSQNRGERIRNRNRVFDSLHRQLITHAPGTAVLETTSGQHHRKAL